MFSRIADARTALTEERTDTLKVLDALTQSALDTAVSPAHRNLRRLAWHLVASMVELPFQMGLRIPGPAVDPDGIVRVAPPEELTTIREAYAAVSAALLAELDGWADADLQKERRFWDMLDWKNGQALLALNMHQAHHRGQMTVLMRQAGLKVPAFYGPVLEDWARMGAPVPAI